MAFKVLVLLVPLIATSLIKTPNLSGYDTIKARPSFSFLPIDSSAIVISSTPVVQQDDYFNCSTYGPFSLTNPQNFQATFTYELHSISSQNIIERIRLCSTSGSVLSASSKTSFYYTKGNRNNVTFTIPLRDYWTSNGLTLKFEILNASNRSILKDYSASFYPPANAFQSGVYLKRNIYTSKSLAFYGNTHDMKELIETYDFTSFGDYLDVDYYYRLDIKNNRFLYTGSTNFTCGSASLSFNDCEYLFPYYTHDSNDDIVIPISFVKNGNTISLKFNKNFYINKRTLQISDSYQSGFSITQDFYLPVNGRNRFNGKQITITLNQMGLDLLSTSFSLRYDASKSLVGVCKDGDYCVVGGRR